jgi:hypothetical protein
MKLMAHYYWVQRTLNKGYGYFIIMGSILL